MRVAAICALGLIALGVISVVSNRETAIRLEHSKHYQQLDANYKKLSVPADSYVEPVVPQIEWYTWAEAKQVAEQTGKPAYIHFTRAANCPACENLRRNVYTDASVIEAANKFLCVEIYLTDPANETAEGKAALAAFGIDRTQGFPQDLFIYPRWSAKNLGVHKVIDIPTEPKAFVSYLNEWYGFLTQ